MSTHYFTLLELFLFLALVLPNFSSACNQVAVHNFCPFDVHLFTVTDPANEQTKTRRGDPPLTATIKHGDVYSHDYQWLKAGGVAFKLSEVPWLNNGTGPEPIGQFEYGMKKNPITGTSGLWYDMSARDCNGNNEAQGSATGRCPFERYGWRIDSGNCPGRVCRPGDSSCRQMYIQANDDQATQGCPVVENMHDTNLSLCPDMAPKVRHSRRGSLGPCPIKS